MYYFIALTYALITLINFYKGESTDHPIVMFWVALILIELKEIKKSKHLLKNDEIDNN